MTRIGKPASLAAVGLLALAVRLAHVASVSAYDPMFAHPVMDARWHVEWARALTLGIWEGGPFFRAPLYPFFLAGLFKLFGTSYVAPRVAQAVIGAFGCVLVAKLGTRLAGARVGIVAGLIAALYGPLVYFDGEFLIESVFLPLVAGSLFLLVRAKDAPSWRIWPVAGLVAGLAAVARPNMFLVALGVAAWIVRELPTWRRRSAAAAAWFCGFLVLVGGVTFYNAAKGGGFVPVASQGGVNFWIGNNALADGKTAMLPVYHGPATKGGSAYRDSIEFNARLEAERRLGRPLRADEVSRYWLGLAGEFVSSETGAWIRLTLRKVAYLINGYEVPSNRELYRVRRWSPVLAALLWEQPLAFPFGIVFPLAVTGIWIASGDQRTDRSVHRLLMIYLIVYAIGVVAFFVTSRHRLPLVPALIPYAAFALIALPKRLKDSGTSRRLTTAALLGGALLVSNLSYFGVREYHRGEHLMNLGYAFVQEKRYEEAVEEYRAAVAEAPRFVRARYNLAAAYKLMGRFEDARRTLREVLELDRDHLDAWVLLGNLESASSNFDSAKRMYGRALQIDPRHPSAHHNLALVYLKTWDYDGYVRHLKLAHQADPDFFPANLALAELLAQQGRPDQAREHLRRAARVIPGDPRVARLLKKLMDE